jgi:hypothetical protein
MKQFFHSFMAIMLVIFMMLCFILPIVGIIFAIEIYTECYTHGVRQYCDILDSGDRITTESYR